MRALLLLGATAAAGFGWQLFDDKPRAGTGLAYLLALVLAAERKGLAQAGSLLTLVLTYLMWSQAAGLACVLWYERLVSRDIGVCDEGTGLPVGMVFAAGLLVVAAEFLRGKR